MSQLSLVSEAPAPPREGQPLVFAEMCAGLASLSRMLEGGTSARPPVSRMGNKWGYAEIILSCLGLSPRQGAKSYLWCEPDDGCRALLMAYLMPSVLIDAAMHLRSWSDEEPRALWERLRAEGPIKGAEGREVARFLAVGFASYKQCQPESGFCNTAGGAWPDRPRDISVLAERLSHHDAPTTIATDAREIARWLRIVSTNRLINLDPTTWHNTGQGGSTFGGAEFCTDIEALEDATRAAGMEWPPVTVVDDGRVLDAREVARWALRAAWGDVGGGSGAGLMYRGPGAVDRCVALTVEGLQCRLDTAHHDAPTVVTDDGRIPAPPFDLSGVISYWDPPYLDTTGYAHDLPRSEWVPIAREWAAAGAWVVISEAEPIPELMAEGWYSVEITACRVGQKRTFSAQKREFLTMSRPPHPDGARAARVALERAQRAEELAEQDARAEQLSVFGRITSPTTEPR